MCSWNRTCEWYVRHCCNFLCTVRAIKCFPLCDYTWFLLFSILSVLIAGSKSYRWEYKKSSLSDCFCETYYALSKKHTNKQRFSKFVKLVNNCKMLAKAIPKRLKVRKLGPLNKSETLLVFTGWRTIITCWGAIAICRSGVGCRCGFKLVNTIWTRKSRESLAVDFSIFFNYFFKNKMRTLMGFIHWFRFLLGGLFANDLQDTKFCSH